MKISCKVDGCDKGIAGIGPHCFRHQVLNDAVFLTPAALDELRVDLQGVVPLSPDERRARLRARALHLMSWDAAAANRHERMARDLGATDADIQRARDEPPPDFR